MATKEVKVRVELGRETRKVMTAIEGWKQVAELQLRERARLTSENISYRQHLAATIKAGEAMKAILAAWPNPDARDINELQMQLTVIDGLREEVEDIGRRTLQSGAPDAGDPEARSHVGETVRGDSGAVRGVA